MTDSRFATAFPRVLLVGDSAPEAFALHISEAAEDLGCATAIWNPRRSLAVKGGSARLAASRLMGGVSRLLEPVPEVRRFVHRGLVAAVEKSGPGLTVVTHDFLQPWQVRDIRARTKAPVVLWFPDAVTQFGRAYFLNAEYDALFMKDPVVVRRLRAEAGINAFYLPECCSPKRHIYPAPMPPIPPEFHCDITTAGTLNANRVAFFRHFSEFSVRIWGAPPPPWLELGPVGAMVGGRYLVYEEKAIAFRSARIVLNNLYPAELGSVNCRTFEACAAGGFQIITERSALPDLFRPGEEVVTFRDLDGARRLVREFLLDPGARSSIAEAGRCRALRDHTYQLRLELMASCLEGRSQGYGT